MDARHRANHELPRDAKTVLAHAGILQIGNSVTIGPAV
jgi:hypothetical protein